MNVEQNNRPSADLGFIFASSSERNGFIDLLSNVKLTRGNDLSYRTTLWNGKKIVAVESGYGEKNVRRATESLIDIFHPTRVISAGFAKHLLPEGKEHLIQSNHFLLPDGREIDFNQNTLVHDHNLDQPTSDSFLEAIMEPDPILLKKANLPYASLLTCDEDPSLNERNDLAEKFHLKYYDRESWWIAEICQKAGIPLLSVRLVLNSKKEKGSTELKNIKSSSGSTSRMFGAFLGALVREPKSLVEFYKESEDTLIASDRLGHLLFDLFKD